MKNIINFEDYWSEENRNVVVPVDLIPVPEVIKPKRKRRNVNKGLWFKSAEDGRWYDTIPQEVGFGIYYDAKYLGAQWYDFDLIIEDDEPYIIVLKSKLPIKKGYTCTYAFGRLLTLDDFDIIPNPDYQE